MLKVYLLNQRRNNSSFTLTGKGGNTVLFNFIGGNVVNNTLARFSTENKYYQDLLEGSEMFKRGVVKLDPVTAKEAARIAHEEESRRQSEILSMIQEPDIKSVTEAISYVAEHFNKVAKTAKQAKEIAEENGVSFPNLRLGKG